MEKYAGGRSVTGVFDLYVPNFPGVPQNSGRPAGAPPQRGAGRRAGEEEHGRKEEMGTKRVFEAREGSGALRGVGLQLQQQLGQRVRRAQM